MLDGGSWWQLEVLGEPYLNKPPLTPWLISLAALLRGACDEIAVRLPGVIAALVGALAAGAAGYRLTAKDRQLAALVSGLGFLASVHILLKARVGETDVTVTALCGLAFAIWLFARTAGSPGVLGWVGVAVSLALAALTKGPIPVAFAALPMVVLPIMEKNARETLAAIVAILLALLPLGGWALLNQAADNGGHWVSEMRLAPSSIGYVDLLLLNGLPLSLIYLLPMLPAAAAQTAEPRRESEVPRWAIHALLLYAVPVTLLVTIAPGGVARYSMPAAWPVAVLAGLWISGKARRWALALFIAYATIVVAAIFQIVQIGFMDGRTTGQRGARQRASELSAALQPLPAGALPVLWDVSPDANVLAYAGRRLYAIAPDELGCRTGGDYLIAHILDRERADRSPSWRPVLPLSDWGLLYRRDPAATQADCVPRNRR